MGQDYTGDEAQSNPVLRDDVLRRMLNTPNPYAVLLDCDAVGLGLRLHSFPWRA